MPIGPVHHQANRHPVALSQHAALDVSFAAIRRVCAVFSPPNGALISAPSRLTQSQSTPFNAANCSPLLARVAAILRRLPIPESDREGGVGTQVRPGCRMKTRSE